MKNTSKKLVRRLNLEGFSGEQVRVWVQNSKWLNEDEEYEAGCCCPCCGQAASVNVHKLVTKIKGEKKHRSGYEKKVREEFVLFSKNW
jgi:hypothetical protein